MTCPSCGAEHAPGQRFCSECGARLGETCPACGTEHAPGQKFCGECGEPLTGAHEPAPSAAAPVPEPTVERRLVSVLFADLVGFTALSETLDAEDARDLLSRYFDTCRRLIGLYGGTVEKFIGDAVMAVWGAPTATEDDAERAVRAALDLVAAVSALGDELGAVELRARAGVLTGEAAVTLGATGQGMVAGNLVNTASRIQSVAEPGSVLVGELTRRVTERTIAYEPAGARTLKGKEQAVETWRALRVVSGGRGQLRSHGLEAPFVGRDRELRQVKDLFHACAEERRAHLVSVTGVAGIGKSRLGWELYKHVDGIAERVLWHRGRCLAYGDGVTYWALADMIRMLCRIAEDEQAEGIAAKLRATVAEHLLDEDDRRIVEPALAQLLGIGGSDVGDRQELFAAWRLFFERLAESEPVVLLFEDLQWADASLLDFVEHLLEWSRGRPLFVLTLARPELQERRPTWGAGQRNFTSLHLEPLPDEAMRAMLDGYVPGLPERLLAQIVERAEGVPLYAVETVRMLIDRGHLVERGASYDVAGEIGELDVPETLQALVASRLDGLAEDERQLLQEGSVLGKTFTVPTLTALTGRSEGQLAPVLAALVRKEVLGLQHDPRSPEYGQYGFLQDIVRRVAYETLARSRRRALHLEAAGQLAATFGEDEVAEIVVAHLLAAQEAMPAADDADVLRERARAALVRAAERAVSLGAAPEAHRYFERAADLTDDAVENAELAFRAGEAAWQSNRPAEARDLLQRAHDVFVAHGDTGAAARVALRLSNADFHEGRGQQAVERLEQALAAVEDGEPGRDLAAVEAELARFLALGGEHDRATTHVERALTVAEALDLPDVLVGALNTRAMILSFRGRTYESLILYEGTLELALALGLHGSVGRLYNNLADALERAGRFAEAVAICDRRLEFDRRHGHAFGELMALAAPTESLVLLGRWDEALARAGEARERSAVVWHRVLLYPAASVWCERGMPDEARRFLAGLDASEEADEDPQLARGRAAVEARLLRADGRPREALARALAGVPSTDDLRGASIDGSAVIVEALEAAASVGDVDTTRNLLATIDGLRPSELTRFLAAQRARFSGRLGVGDVGADFAQAAKLFREAETPFYLAVTLLEHGEWLVGQSRADEAQPLVDEASLIFDRLAATPWLERARAASTAPTSPAIA